MHVVMTFQLVAQLVVHRARQWQHINTSHGKPQPSVYLSRQDPLMNFVVHAIHFHTLSKKYSLAWRNLAFFWPWLFLRLR